MSTMDVQAIQAELATLGCDGWLFADFRRRDELAYRLLELDGHPSRRWFYYVPRSGEPTKIVHRIEAGMLDTLPGSKLQYSAWKELHEVLRKVLGKGTKVAMQYSPLNAIPTVSYADAGVVELVRSFGVEVVSSAALATKFGGVLTAAQIQSHIDAQIRLERVRDGAFELIRSRLRASEPLTEMDVFRFIRHGFDAEGLTCEDHGPIVGVNDHAADPHYEPTEAGNRKIQHYDAVLIDLWAKLKTPGAVYYDITWCGFCGEEPPAEYAKMFTTAMQGRDAALDLVLKRLGTDGNPQALAGYEVDDACRTVIERAGYGERFTHRTGHAIDTRTHGAGVNIDNFESRDERPILPGACFSIEPGIYGPKLGVRTEINVCVGLDGVPRVYGQVQKQLLCL